jgi:hypothetical protein
VSAFEIRLEPAWPADFVAFAAGAAGRSFAHGERFRAAFAEHGPGWEPRLLVARPAGGGPHAPIAAAWLGYAERRWGGTWMRSLPFGAPAGPLFAPALDRDARRAAARPLWDAFDRLHRNEGWLGGDLTFSGPAADDAELRPARGGRERVAVAHVIDLSAGPAVWRAGLRKRARQQFTKAERMGVTVEPQREPADLDAVYREHVAQVQGWTGGRGLRPLAFYRALLVEPTPWRLWVARLGDAVVCGVLVHVEPEEAYMWWSGSSPEARRTLAFPAVLDCAVRECGSRTVNIGFSGEQRRLTFFKEQLGAVGRDVPIFEPSARPRNPYAALLAIGRDTLRHRRARREAAAAAAAARAAAAPGASAETSAEGA